MKTNYEIKTVYDIEQELAMKEERIAHWEQHGSILEDNKYNKRLRI